MIELFAMIGLVGGLFALGYPIFVWIDRRTNGRLADALDRVIGGAE